MNPLVSVIVPTKNSSKFLDACLSSILNQTYGGVPLAPSSTLRLDGLSDFIDFGSFDFKTFNSRIEILVVDNNSTDDTKEIAKRYTDKVFNQGPERSAQRNFGVREAKGRYVAIIDSDMELSPNVIADCVAEISKDGIAGVVIPEESFGVGFWAQCKRLERSFYVGVSWMEAGRFFPRDTYIEVDGYNESMVSGEDWDLSQRIEVKGKIGRISSFIRHNEGDLKLFTTLKKKFYYAQQFARYTNTTSSEKVLNQTSIFARYCLFFSQPNKLFRNLILGIGMLFMKTCEFGVGGISYLLTPSEKITNKGPDLNISDTDHPFVSYIIPTYNAEKYLKRCLDSVFAQDYPKNKYEVIIADGGSTDSTRDILKMYEVQLIENPRRIAEYGKFLAYKKSKGEFIVLLDADNIIASKDWLISLISPLSRNESLIGAESNYLIADDYSAMNTYATLLVVVDPLARMLASRPHRIVKDEGHAEKIFKKGSSPVAGANGFVWRKSVIEKYLNVSLEKLEETNLLSYISSNQEMVIVNVNGKGIYHYYCESFWDYIEKRKKIARKYLVRKSNKERTWVEQEGTLKLVISSIYLATIVGPFLESIINFIKTRKKEWLLHPLVSFVTIYVYTVLYIKKKLIQTPTV